MYPRLCSGRGRFTACLSAAGRSKKAREVSSMRVTRGSGTPWPAIVKKPISVQAAFTACAIAARSPGVRAVKGARSMTGTVVSMASPARLAPARELERVLQHVVRVGTSQALAPLGVAGQHRLEDLAVLGHARLDPLGQVEGPQAQDEDLRVDVLEQPAQHRIPRRDQHPVVEVDGRARVLLHLVRAGGAFHPLHGCLEGGARVVVEILGGLADREGLQRAADREEIADLVSAVVQHEDTVAGHGVDQALALESPHRVPDRGAAHPEIAADLLDIELGAGREDLAQDQVADGPVYSLAEALVEQGRDRGAGRGGSRGWHGAVFLGRLATMSIGFSFDT